MNSTLQCLAAILSWWFTDPKQKEKIAKIIQGLSESEDEPHLLPVFEKLVNELNKTVIGVPGTPVSYSPYDFMSTIEKMNPLFKVGQAGDSKDFIIYILEQLHKELKKPLAGAQQENILLNQYDLNQYDKDNAFVHFFSDFKRETSVISDNFFGFTETTNVCLNCKQIFNSKNRQNPICYNYQIFNCLIFPLEEVKNTEARKFDPQFNPSNYPLRYPSNYPFTFDYPAGEKKPSEPIVTLKNCFDYNAKTDLFTGQSQNYCNVCKQLYDSLYTSKICNLPNNLVLILNRGKGNIFNVKLDFTKFLNTNDTEVTIVQQRYNFYKLSGEIIHIGQSGPSAHFIANVVSYANGKTLKRFNDAMVTPVKNFNKEVVDFGVPYMLFYKVMSHSEKLDETLDFLLKNANESGNSTAIDRYTYYRAKMFSKFKKLSKKYKEDMLGTPLQKYAYLLGFCWINRSDKLTDMKVVNISEGVLCDAIYETFDEIENEENFDLEFMKKLECKIEMRVWLAGFQPQRGNVIAFIDNLNHNAVCQNAVCDLLLYAATRRIKPFGGYSAIPSLIYAVFDTIRCDSFCYNSVEAYKCIIDGLAYKMNTQNEFPMSQQDPFLSWFPSLAWIENEIKRNYVVNNPQFDNSDGRYLFQNPSYYQRLNNSYYQMQNNKNNIKNNKKTNNNINNNNINNNNINNNNINNNNINNNNINNQGQNNVQMQYNNQMNINNNNKTNNNFNNNIKDTKEMVGPKKVEEITVKAWINKATETYKLELSEDQKKRLEKYIENNMEKNKKLTSTEYYNKYGWIMETLATYVKDNKNFEEVLSTLSSSNSKPEDKEEHDNNQINQNKKQNQNKNLKNNNKEEKKDENDINNQMQNNKNNNNKKQQKEKLKLDDEKKEKEEKEQKEKEIENQNKTTTTKKQTTNINDNNKRNLKLIATIGEKKQEQQEKRRKQLETKLNKEEEQKATGNITKSDIQINNLTNNNPQNNDMVIMGMVNSSNNSFDVFCNILFKQRNGDIDLNKLNFDAAKLCFWNCFRAFFSVLFFRPKVNCSFWHLVYLKVVYENIRSKGSSYYFEAPEESNNPSQNSNGEEQYKKNIRWFSSALNESKKQTEQANENPNVNENSKNLNQQIDQ